MAFSKTGLAAVSLAALFLAGCNTTRVSSMDTRAEPLTPAPAGTVTGGALPPPATPQTADPSQFPSAPGAGTTVAAVTPSPETLASAPDITAGSVAGVWNATVSGQSCKVATPQTKFGAGFRAGPLRCPTPVDGVKSWNVAGKQLSFYDADGSVLARLYPSGPEKFDGQTSTGLPISLSR
jgi:hypothetical protein